MTEQQYAAALKLAWTVAHALMCVPLVELHEAQARCDTLGPMLDPTRYRDAVQGVQADKYQQDQRITTLLLDLQGQLAEMGMQVPAPDQWPAIGLNLMQSLPLAGKH
jgi:hypothetical protein